MKMRMTMSRLAVCAVALLATKTEAVGEKPETPPPSPEAQAVPVPSPLITELDNLSGLTLNQWNSEESPRVLRIKTKERFKQMGGTDKFAFDFTAHDLVVVRGGLSSAKGKVRYTVDKDLVTFKVEITERCDEWDESPSFLYLQAYRVGKEAVIAQAVSDKTFDSEMLLSAVYAADVEKTKAELAKGTRPDGVKFGEALALRAALMGGRPGMLELLLSAGIKVDARSEKGWTALHEAAWGLHPDAVKVLLAAGAQVNAAANDGKHPIDIAIECEKHERELNVQAEILDKRVKLIQLLRDNGAKPSSDKP